MLLATSFVFLSVYILAPTLKFQLLSNTEREKMFSSKRKDRLTIGLINTKNDCFANSAIQAFASLPGLKLYLNEVLQEHNTLLSLKDALILKEGEEIPEVLLHEGLGHILYQLQESITKSKNTSVWPFLRVIEKIYNSKISTSQNDAHELVQLILETLDSEIVKLKKFVKEHAHEIAVSVNIPELPFNGLLADQLTCLSCTNSSKPTFYPFSVLSLPVPGTFTANLKEMIRSNEAETITGYNCLRCRVQAILKIEEDKALRGIIVSEESSQMVSKLKVMETNLFINDDLTGPLDSFVENYESNGFKLDKLSSTIVKKTLIIKPPNLLTVHLSRSLFVANHVKRNGCHVEFDDILDVNINESLASAYESLASTYESQQRELRKKNKKLKEEEENSKLPTLDELELVRSHSKVLTQTEQIEDSFVHQENEDEHRRLEETASAEINTQATSSTPTSATSLQSKNPNTSTTDVMSLNSSDQPSVSSSSSSIISEQLIFHNNTMIRYKLRAMIRHQGTHNAGHYECYRHKPNFMKDTIDDMVVNLSPSIKPRQTSSANSSAPDVKIQTSADQYTIGPKEQSDEGTPQKRTESSSSSFMKGIGTPLESTSRVFESDADEYLLPPQTKERRRSRLSSFVSQFSGSSNGSRRGSTANINTDDHLANIAESSLGLAEDGSDDNRKTVNGDSTEINGKSKPKNPEKRYKKVSSVAKYPFWRISDTNVNEVKRDEVLREKNVVYMIYYERVTG